MIAIRRAFLVLLLICPGCVAQSTPPDVARKIERRVRASYAVPADIKVVVGSLAPSNDLAGYDAVTVTIDGGEGRQKELKFLISKDRTNMVRFYDLTKDPFAEVMSKIDVKGRPTRGAKSAKVVAINFDDFECPYCSRMHETLFPTILKEYGDRVTFIYKDYPLAEIHPWAIHAAVDANCLAAQNVDAFWDFADYIHANKQVVDNEKTAAARFDALDKLVTLQGQKHNLDAAKLQSCIKAQDESGVRASMQEGDDLGVNGTPALFINGQKIDGAVPIGEIRAALDSALKDAGEPVPAHPADAASPSK